MNKVLKWSVPVDDKPHGIGGGKVVHIASQYGNSNTVEVWTHEDGETFSKFVQVYGTGHELPPESRVLGSAIVAGGSLVWHVVDIDMSKYPFID